MNRKLLQRRNQRREARARVVVLLTVARMKGRREREEARKEGTGIEGRRKGKLAAPARVLVVTARVSQVVTPVQTQVEAGRGMTKEK